jgi:anaerobic selenocysteine-containing dehydrogenase
MGVGVRRYWRTAAAYDANSAVFYASGRASLETAYMYQLLARLHGTNNLPDCSNMCHETTSVALPESIGVPVGTVILDDFQHADAIFFFGQNVGSNSPRMLHDLQEPAGAAFQSSRSIRCASAAWRSSPTRKVPRRCWRVRRPESARSFIR